MAETAATDPIVITGGARRLGLAAALALREENYPVVVTYRTAHPSLAMLRDKGIETIKAGFSTESGVLHLAAELRSRHQSLRALVHNASEWLPEGAARSDSKKHIAYAASKAALDNLTLSFASKFAPLVKVNSIAPALLMFQQGDDEAYRQKALQKSLLGIEPGEAEGVNVIR